MVSTNKDYKHELSTTTRSLETKKPHFIFLKTPIGPNVI